MKSKKSSQSASFSSSALLRPLYAEHYSNLISNSQYGLVAEDKGGFHGTYYIKSSVRYFKLRHARFAYL